MNKFSKVKPTAIILGGHVQAYGIIRLLGELGHCSLIVDVNDRNIARHSKYCSGYIKAEYHKIIDLLIRLEEDERYRECLIIPTDDYYVKILSENFDRLSENYKIVVDEWDIVKIFYNKNKSYPWVNRIGIPIPPTYWPKTINEVKNLSDDLAYPCIIKPAIMKDFYKKYGKKVLVCNNAEELISLAQRISEDYSLDDVMVQEIIEGSSENQYSVGLFAIEGEIQHYVIARRKRQHPPDFGNATTYAEIVEKPILLEYASKIMIESNYTGVCEVEFKYDAKLDLYKFLEVNTRFWKWHLIAKQANVPIVEAMYEYYSKGKIINRSNQKNAAWQDIVTDVPTILNMKLKGLYYAPIKTPEIHAVFNRNDLMPFVMQLLYLPFFLKMRR